LRQEWKVTSTRVLAAALTIMFNHIVKRRAAIKVNVKHTKSTEDNTTGLEMLPDTQFKLAVLTYTDVTTE